jgi:hypothetical protein
MSEDLGMENQKRFVVFEPYEIWYRTEVLASSKEEAIAKASHPSFIGEWELDLETGSALDVAWEAYSDEEDDK